MKNVLILLRTFKTDSSKKFTKSQLYLLWASLALATFTLAFIFEFALYKQLKSINFEDDFIYLTLIFTTIFIVVFSITNIFLDFYYKENTLNLFIFPIKTIEIAIYKLIKTLKIPYFLSFAIFYVSTLVYGFNEQLGFSYFVLSVFTTLLLPLFIILPLSILILLFINVLGINFFLKAKKFIYIVSLLLGTLIGLAIKNLNLEAILLDMENLKPIFNLFGGSYFLVENITKDGNWLFSLFYMFIILLFNLFIFYIAFSKFYYKTLLKISHSNKKIYKHSFKKHTEIINLIMFDLKSIIRRPFLLVNLAIKPFLFPIMMLTVLTNIKNMQNGYSDEINTYIIITIGLIYLQSSLNLVAATSITREGLMYWFKKALPINTKTIFYGKIILGFILNIIPIMSTILIFYIVIDVHIVIIIKILLIAILMCFSESILCFTKDVKDPIIDYKEEKKIISSNPNLIILYVISIIKFLVFIALGSTFNLAIDFILIVFLIKVLFNILIFEYRLPKYINKYNELG